MLLELKMFPSCMNFVVRFQLVQHLPGLSCWVCADFKWCILTLWLKRIRLWEESLSLNCRSLGEILSPYIFFFFFSSPVQWRQSSQVALSGSRSEGGGCHGSRGTCSLSVYDDHIHTQWKVCIGSILDCRIINKPQQKAAPLSLIPAPAGPHHSHFTVYLLLSPTFTSAIQ